MPLRPLLRSQITLSTQPLFLSAAIRSRPFSSSTTAPSTSVADTFSSPSPVLPARWISDTKQRIGKCIMFGLTGPQIQEAGEVLSILSREWKELSAGSEGFLTERKRTSLEGHKIVWGEMDSMVRIFISSLLLGGGRVVS